MPNSILEALALTFGAFSALCVVIIAALVYLLLSNQSASTEESKIYQEKIDQLKKDIDEHESKQAYNSIDVEV